MEYLQNFLDQILNPIWINQIAQIVKHQGAVGAGIVFLVLTFAFIATGRIINKPVIGYGGATLSFLFGAAFLTAGVLVPAASGEPPAGYHIAKIKSIPTTLNVAPISSDTYVNLGLVEGCVRDAIVIQTNAQAKMEIRIFFDDQKSGRDEGGKLGSKSRNVCDRFRPIDDDDAALPIEYDIETTDLVDPPAMTIATFVFKDRLLMLGKKKITRSASLHVPEYSSNVVRNSEMWVNSARAEVSNSDTYDGLLTLFSGGNLAEIYRGSDQLAATYPTYRAAIMRSLTDENTGTFQDIGLLLATRKYLSTTFIKQEKPIPPYDDAFVKSLLRLSTNDNDLLRSTARILLRSQPTSHTKDLFDQYFAKVSDPKAKERLAATGADIYYNFAFKTLFPDQVITGDIYRATLPTDNAVIAKSMIAFDQGYKFGAELAPSEKYLAVKALYGKGVVLSKLGVEIANNTNRQQAGGTTAISAFDDASRSFKLFVDEANKVGSYKYPDEITVATQCRYSPDKPFVAVSDCLAKFAPK